MASEHEYPRFSDAEFSRRQAAVLSHFVDGDDACFNIDGDIRHLNTAYAAIGELPSLLLGLPANYGNAACSELVAGLPPAQLPAEVHFHRQARKAGFDLRVRIASHA